MLGMKRDCGGAAGILGAFRAAVKQVSLKSVTLSKLLSLLCNSSFQVKCLLEVMWLWFELNDSNRNLLVLGYTYTLLPPG